VDPEFWERHWWLLIVLAAMVVPIFGIIFNGFTTWLYFQHRRDALEALKTYSAQGKTPPPEIVEALSGGRRDAGPADWTDDFTDSWGYGDRYARRAARQAMRAARWRYREPYRRWNGAITMVALAAGFGIASQYASRQTADAFLLVAIIMGAVALAAVIQAVLATILRPGP
jgi:hypothetical protein